MSRNFEITFINLCTHSLEIKVITQVSWFMYLKSAVNRHIHVRGADADNRRRSKNLKDLLWWMYFCKPCSQWFRNLILCLSRNGIKFSYTFLEPKCYIRTCHITLFWISALVKSLFRIWGICNGSSALIITCMH